MEEGKWGQGKTELQKLKFLVKGREYAVELCDLNILF
jgi:hypothetical protein